MLTKILLEKNIGLLDENFKDLETARQYLKNKYPNASVLYVHPINFFGDTIQKCKEDELVLIMQQNNNCPEGVKSSWLVFCEAEDNTINKWMVYEQK